MMMCRRPTFLFLNSALTTEGRNTSHTAVVSLGSEQTVRKPTSTYLSITRKAMLVSKFLPTTGFLSVGVPRFAPMSSSDRQKAQSLSFSEYTISSEKPRLS